MMDQIIMCNVRGVAHSDKPTENYDSTLQLVLDIRGVLGFYWVLPFLDDNVSKICSKWSPHTL